MNDKFFLYLDKVIDEAALALERLNNIFAGRPVLPPGSRGNNNAAAVQVPQQTSSFNWKVCISFYLHLIKLGGFMIILLI